MKISINTRSNLNPSLQDSVNVSVNRKMLAEQKNSALLFKNPLLASSSAASARDLKSLCKNMLFGQYFLCNFYSWSILWNPKKQSRKQLNNKMRHSKDIIPPNKKIKILMHLQKSAALTKTAVQKTRGVTVTTHC